MSDAANFTLSLLRGDDYSQPWSITDQAGASLLASGDTLALHFKDAQGGTLLGTINGTPDGSGSSISGLNTTTGAFTVTIRAGTLASIFPTGTTDRQSKSFALQKTTGGGLVTTYAFGPLHIDPAP